MSLFILIEQTLIELLYILYLRQLFFNYEWGSSVGVVLTHVSQQIRYILLVF